MPHAAAGFFGKLPSAGDFVQRRLPPAFVDAWDRHFEGAVAQSRGSMDGEWHDAYLGSPVWRFVLAPRVCGEAAWAGVMGPGVDRVGRCFPMVVAAPVGADPGACLHSLLAGDGWFDAAERTLCDGQLDAAIGVDEFDQRVAVLGGPLDGSQPRAAGFPDGIDWAAADHWRLPLPQRASATTYLSELWKRVAAAPGSWCLWWTAGAERVPASVLITDGLPRASAYAGFLDATQGSAQWQSLGTFEPVAAPPGHDAPEPPVASVPAASPVPPPVWLPDDPELFGDLGLDLDLDLASAPQAVAVAVAAPAEPATMEAPVAAIVDGVSVLHRPECALTLVAAQVGPLDPRQRAVTAVTAVARGVSASELAGDMQHLRMRIMALNPSLRQSSEDLIDPVLEDCAVIAAHVADGQVDLLRIGTAAAWHWRRGRLQPFFAKSDAPPAAQAGIDSDFDDLLFSGVPLAAPGLGAMAQPTCGEVFCAVEAGDRLLLVATGPLVQLAPELLAQSLAIRSCDEACARLAAAAGLGADRTQWPLKIIEIDA